MNITDIDRVKASSVPRDTVIIVTIDVTKSEINSRIFLYIRVVLGRRCIDKRSANMLTKPIILIDVS
jgi:hypothetical protein